MQSTGSDVIIYEVFGELYSHMSGPRRQVLNGENCPHPALKRHIGSGW